MPARLPSALCTHGTARLLSNPGNLPPSSHSAAGLGNWCQSSRDSAWYWRRRQLRSGGGILPQRMLTSR